MRMTGMALQVVRSDGVLALYNGLSASLCRQVPLGLPPPRALGGATHSQGSRAFQGHPHSLGAASPGPGPRPHALSPSRLASPRPGLR